jgi:hypothetical protein
MTSTRSTVDGRTVARRAAAAGPALAAVGILILRFVGAPMPAVPPSLVLLVGAAVLVSVVDRRWAALVGVVVAVAEIAGFLLAGGLVALLGSAGAGIMVGNWVRVVGSVLALVAGVAAACAPRRRAGGA